MFLSIIRINISKKAIKIRLNSCNKIVESKKYDKLPSKYQNIAIKDFQ
jgi:hypothetical protein